MPFNTSDLQTSTPLTDLSLKVMNDPAMFAGRRIAPMRKVAKPSGTIKVYSLTNLRVEDDRRGRSDVAREIGRDLTEVSYTTDERGLRAPIPWKDQDEAEAPLDQQQMDWTEELAEKMAIRHEKAVYDLISASGNYASGHSTTLGTAWDAVGGDPIGDVRAGKQVIRGKIGRYPNSLAIGAVDFEKLRTHADILDLYKHTTAGPVAPELVARALGVEQIFVAGSIENSGAEPTDTLADIWASDIAVLFYQNPSPRRRSVDFLRTLEYEPVNTRTYTIEEKRTDYVETNWEYGLKFMTVDTAASGLSVAGYLIQNIRT